MSALLLADVKAMARYCRPCKGCGVLTWFVKSGTGTTTPYAEDPANSGQAVNHFTTCPSGQRFRRSRKKKKAAPMVR